MLGPVGFFTPRGTSMSTHTCAQKGCQFEAEAAPENCPTCGHPFHEHPDPAATHVQPGEGEPKADTSLPNG